MISVIAIDVDGTLLNNNNEISLENKKAIEHALSNDIEIVLCSGRPPASLQEINKKILNINDPVWTIGLNGSVIFNSYNLEAMIETRMSPYTTKKILYYIEKHFPYTPLSIHSNYNEIYVENITPQALEYGELVNLPVIKIESFEKVIKQGALKIQIHYKEDVLKKIYEQFNNNSDYEKFMSQKDYLEFAPKGVNKGSALEILSEKMGLSIDKNVAAIGDNGNDIEMIKKSALGIAVNNAKIEAKIVADYVTVSNNNQYAVAEAIEHIMKNVSKYN